jgi:hypothetical protein
VPITDDQRQRIIDLHGKGVSRNDIARQTGVSAGTVTNVCKANDLTFDRSATKDATRARVEDNKARRAAIVSRLYTRSERILDRLEASTFMVRMMGPNGSEKVYDEEPPAEAERSLATSIGIYLDKAAKLEDYDRSAADTASGAVSVIDKLMAGFTKAYEAGQ